MNNNNGKIWYQQGIDNSQLKRDADEAIRKFREIGNTAQTEGARADDSFRKIGTGLAAAFSAQQMAAVVKSVIDVRGQFQQLEITMETMLGSKAKADKLMSEIVAFAAKTPFDLKGVASGAKQLLAYGFQAEEVIQSLKMMGDVASGISQPIGDLVYLYGTLHTQGVAQLMDIRQLAGRGIPVYEELAKVFKVSTSEVNNLVSAGKVGFPEIQKIFSNMTSEGGKFYNLTEKNAASLTGLISNLGDTWEQILNKEGEKSEGMFADGIKIASGVLEDYEKYLDILKAIIMSYGTYKAILAATYVIQKASLALDAVKAFNATTAALTRTTQAQIILNKALGANPYAKLAGIVIMAASAVYMLSKRTEDLTEISKKAKESTAEEMGQLTLLTGVAKNEKLSKEERLKAIKQLNDISPKYLGNLSLENIATAEATKSIEGYSKAIEQNARAKAAQNLITEKQQQILENEAKINKVKPFFDSSVKGSESYRIYEDKIGRLEDKNKRLQGEISNIIASVQTVAAAGTSAAEGTVTTVKENAKKIEAFTLEADNRLLAARIALMEEGTAKLIAQAKLNSQNTLSEIDADEKEKLDKYRKYIEDGGKAIAGTEDKIRNEAKELRKVSAEQEEKDITNIKKRESDTIAGIWKDVTLRFESELNKQLSDIDRYYNEAVEKAKGHQDIIDKLNSSRDKEKSLARLSSQLGTLGFGEEIALNKNDNDSTGMYERQERRKTEILKQYAEKRVEILRTMGTEQSNQDADVLSSTISGYNKALSQPKSLKNIVDDKVFEKVKNHFVKLGETQEKAEEKTGSFFEGFTKGGKIAGDVIGVLQGAFGGVSEELDMALNAAMNIADGFAKGGIVGGIAAAGQELIKVTVGLLTARKQIDQSMIDGYKLYIEAIDRLIDKQIDALESLGGSAFANSLREINNEIEKRTAANIRLLREAQKAGSGLFSHSDGYKTNEILKQQSAYLRQAGIYKTDISRLTEDELVKLRDVADVWARLPEGIRTYIDDLAESKEQLEDLQNQLQDMLLGFEATDIRDAIVDSFTDGAIDNAMADFEAKADDLVAGIMKNIMTNLMLTEPINAAINQLMKGLATYDSDGNITGFKDVNSIEKTVLSNFKETIMSLADGFGKTWEDLSKQFGDMGIDLYGNEPESATRTGSSKGIAQASQTSIDELNGRATVIQSHTFSISEDMKFLRNNSSAILNQLIGIKENTDELRPIREDMSEVKKSMVLVRDGIRMITTEGISLK